MKCAICEHEIRNNIYICTICNNPVCSKCAKTNDSGEIICTECQKAEHADNVVGVLKHEGIDFKPIPYDEENDND